MKNFRGFLLFFALLFVAFIVSAADSAAIFPVAAKERDERTVAKEIDRSLEALFDKLEGVEALSFKDILSTKARKELSKCRENLSCQQKLAKKASKKADFFFYTKLKLTSKNKVIITAYLFDGKNNPLEKKKQNFSGEADPDKIAKSLVKTWNKFLSKHVSASVSDEDEADEDEEAEEEPEPSKRRGKKSVDAIIMEAFESYAQNDLKTAEKILKEVESQDVVAKKLLDSVEKISKYAQRANGAIKAKNYDEAIPIIAKAEKLDKDLVELGVKYRAYSKETVETLVYLEPTAQNIRDVDMIRRKFSKKSEKFRKERVAANAKIDKWLNGRIVAREAKLKKFAEDSKAAAEQEKIQYGELTKKINDYKYKWQKDDSELEQKIVELENKLTLFEQREKGVVKVSTDNVYEKAMRKELDETDKKYGDLLKKMKEEKEAFYKKHDSALEAGNKKTEAEVLKLEEKKKANEAKIAEIDKKISTEQEKFDEQEKKFMSGNEEIKMSNEDEDRKYKVKVEEEYQTKFDNFNKKLLEYDAQEAEKRKDLEKYDAEIEEYMFKNAEVMQKVMEESEKEKASLETEFKAKEEAAAADAEKAYQEELEKLNKERGDVEAKIAEKETPALKKQLAASEKKIAKHESDRDNFIAKKIAKVSSEKEEKMAAIDMKMAKRSDELNRDNEKFRKAKSAEKKKAEANFQGFLKRKAMFKKSIDSQVAAAQKERDKKIEARSKERAKLSGSWSKESEKRRQALDRKLQLDKKNKERLTKENDKLNSQIAIANAKWAEKSDDIKIKHQEASEKFEKTWQERYDKTDAEYKAKKEAVENKYAEKQVADKDAQKQQKEKWELEIQSLNEEKQKRKEKRQDVLKEEEAKWLEKKSKWTEEEKQRKIDEVEFAKDMKRLNIEDRKEAAEKKKEADLKYEEETKVISEQEMEQIRKKFKEDYKITKSREAVGVKGSANIKALKAEAFAKSGLVKLQEKDLLSAKRAFAEALRVDKENQIALDGMKSINVTAESMYWEAYGIRDSNKAKAKEIFTLLTKTLTPSNEFFIKARIALEDLD